MWKVLGVDESQAVTECTAKLTETLQPVNVAQADLKCHSNVFQAPLSIIQGLQKPQQTLCCLLYKSRELLGHEISFKI